MSDGKSPRRAPRVRRGSGRRRTARVPTATIAELVSSGAGVLAVAADASRRAALANGATGLARFNGGAALIACHRCGAEAVAGLAARAEAGWRSSTTRRSRWLRTSPRPSSTSSSSTRRARRSMSSASRALRRRGPVADGAPRRRRRRRPTRPRSSRSPARRSSRSPTPPSRRPRRRPAGTGFVHPLYSDAEREFSLGVLGRQAPSRETIAGVFRALRTAGQASRPRAARGARRARPAPARSRRPPRVPSACCGSSALVAGDTSAGAGVVGVVSSEGTDLERSAAFRVYSKEHSEAQSFLQSPKFP